mmetsp:Transcript_37324/g.90664  ORF Transcript_37324/g.90664 Transcript_37324/m.90664 type:complete len:229 (-) Transcript_37324:1220-1906(-)
MAGRANLAKMIFLHSPSNRMVPFYHSCRRRHVTGGSVNVPCLIPASGAAGRTKFVRSVPKTIPKIRSICVSMVGNVSTVRTLTATRNSVTVPMPNTTASPITVGTVKSKVRRNAPKGPTSSVSRMDNARPTSKRRHTRVTVPRDTVAPIANSCATKFLNVPETVKMMENVRWVSRTSKRPSMHHSGRHMIRISNTVNVPVGGSVKIVKSSVRNVATRIVLMAVHASRH